ncbi:LysR family transcriptional regulator [Streptomyces asiaticus]|uniref:LysR family transcriptional regulator n=1 Tax=Streptomyces asiaticus TaxID=114695 RepID=UPI001FE4A06A|nr:LysR family transcriptional regulator [Streptomyces asiaticus]
MAGLEIRELECFLVLSEELHFGRAAERLYVSQSRVSQLLRNLERRIGARLLERTSRRARLTPLGERFLTELRPAYEALYGAFETARGAARGVDGVLRIGFQGAADERVTAAIAAFRECHPGCEPTTVEIPLADPFGAVRAGEVDAAIVCLPVAEPDLVLGPVFSKQPQTVVVSARHPFAGRGRVDAEALADCPLIGPSAPRRATGTTRWRPSPPPAGGPSRAGHWCTRSRRGWRRSRRAGAGCCCAPRRRSTTAAGTSPSYRSRGCRTRCSAWCGGGRTRPRGYGRSGGRWRSCALRRRPNRAHMDGGTVRVGGG